jgi:hypothetical protein
VQTAGLHIQTMAQMYAVGSFSFVFEICQNAGQRRIARKRTVLVLALNALRLIDQQHLIVFIDNLRYRKHFFFFLCPVHCIFSRGRLY